MMTPEKPEEHSISDPLTKLPILINIKSEQSEEEKEKEKKNHSTSKKSLKRNNFGKRKSKETTSSHISNYDKSNNLITQTPDDSKSDDNSKTYSSVKNNRENAPQDIEIAFEDIKAEPTTVENEKPATEEQKKEKQKMVITGDDILIEYVTRIVKLLENYQKIYNIKCQDPLDRVDEFLPQTIRFTLEKFARHKIWSNKFDA